MNNQTSLDEAWVSAAKPSASFDTPTNVYFWQ
jgi:hypothetical protein